MNISKVSLCLKCGSDLQESQNFRENSKRDERR